MFCFISLGFTYILYKFCGSIAAVSIGSYFGFIRITFAPGMGASLGLRLLQIMKGYEKKKKETSN